MIDKEQLISIVTAAQKGEENAVSELYNAFYMDVHYYIMKTVKDTELAADLTQDTFIEIMQTIKNLREPVTFPVWSRRIAYHKCTAHFRKKKDVLESENEEGLSVFDNIVEERDEFIPDEALDKDELKRAIQEMIDELPEEQRSAIMMRYFDEIPVKDIALIQGVTEGTVKSRLNYARKAIKHSVHEYEKINGIRIHSKGVVPLLLWIFREYKIASEISGATENITETVTETVTTTATAASFKGTIAKVLAVLTAMTVVAGSVWTKEPEPIEEEFQSMDDVLLRNLEDWEKWDGFEGEEIGVQLLCEIVGWKFQSYFNELKSIEQIEEPEEREDSRLRHFGLKDSSAVKWAVSTDPNSEPRFYAMVLQVNDIEKMSSVVEQLKENLDPDNWEYYPYDEKTGKDGERTTFWKGITKDELQFYVNQDYLLVTYVDSEAVENGYYFSSENMQQKLDDIVHLREELDGGL